MFNFDHALSLIRTGAYQVPHLPHKWNINDARWFHGRRTHAQIIFDNKERRIIEYK